ncbi:MAG: lipocalin family protein [Spongiibacteraceae bacterium]
MRISLVALALLAVLSINGCNSAPSNAELAASGRSLPQLDLPRYMGRWYVIANIPYFAERGFVGSYSQWTLREDSTDQGAIIIRDEFFGRKKSFDTEFSRHEFVDRVVPDSGNAHWRVRLFWPIYVSQLTLYVDPDYQYTLVGLDSKNYGWIFARSPDISDEKYQELLGRFGAMGYDTTLFKRVPQRAEQIGQPGFADVD